MSASLCPFLPGSFTKAATFDEIFDKTEGRNVRTLELREQPIMGVPGRSCETKLFFGFFFDGTKNNYVQAEKGKNHSNVARLYDCYPGLSVPGVLPASTNWQYKPHNYTHFFKVYVPGVATPFKEVNDSGEGVELTRGAAMGYRGEARIAWALIQAINNVHRYFHQSPIVSAAEATALVYRLDLAAASRRALQDASLYGFSLTSAGKTRDHFKSILHRLHAALAQHWADKQTGRPKKTDPGIVQTIHSDDFTAKAAASHRPASHIVSSKTRSGRHHQVGSIARPSAAHRRADRTHGSGISGIA